jgi:hypothetical protein
MFPEYPKHFCIVVFQMFSTEFECLLVATNGIDRTV